MNDIDATPVAVHANSWRGSLMDAGPALLVGVGMVLSIYGASSTFGDDLESVANLSLLTGIVAMFGAVVWQKYHKRIRRVELFEHGFIWSDGRIHYAAWDEIAVFTYARPRDLIGQLRLPCVAIEFFDGERITLDHGLEKLPSLAAFVRKATFDHLLGRADTDASLGPIHFGPLVLSLRGLSLGACIWEWSEIKYAIDGGSLVIVPATGPFGSDEHFRIPLVDIPNVGVLIRLMAKRGKPPVHIRETQPTRLAIH